MSIIDLSFGLLFSTFGMAITKFNEVGHGLAFAGKISVDVTTSRVMHDQLH
jgi:hypothetical protein